MDRRFTWIFLVASGVFFVFIVGLTGYRIEDVRRANRSAVEERLPALADKAASIRDTAGGFDAPQFKADMRAVFDAEPRLLLLSVHSTDNGILYLVTRSQAFLKDPMTPTPDWRGTPRYHVNQGDDVLLTQDIADQDSSVTMDALYLIMGREDLYPVVRDDLYFFLAFLLICGVFILIFMTVQEDRMARRTNAGPVVTPASQTALSPEPEAPPQEPRPSAPPAQQNGDPIRALTSPRTGLGWADHLEPRLKAELERAAASDQDIALARVRIDEPFADAKLPLVHSEIAHMLHESFPLRDLLFESGSDSYAIVLPDLDVDAAVRQVDEFRKRLAANPVQGKNRTISAGVTSRGGRLIDEQVLRDEAEIAVAKASREGGNQVIGFRADPSLFRDSLNEIHSAS